MNVITSAQRTALSIVAERLDASYYLAGGVAVALKFHHRISLDLDVFTAESDPALLAGEFGAAPTTRVASQAKGTLHLEVAGIPVSLIRYSYPFLEPPSMPEGLPLASSSVDDLIAMKLSAISGRGAARDFWDLHTMLSMERRTLRSAIALFERKFATTDVGHVVRSLAYFTDAEAEPMPRGLTREQWSTIRSDIEAWVVAL